MRKGQRGHTEAAPASWTPPALSVLSPSLEPLVYYLRPVRQTKVQAVELWQKYELGGGDAGPHPSCATNWLGRLLWL